MLNRLNVKDDWYINRFGVGGLLVLNQRGYQCTPSPQLIISFPHFCQGIQWHSH